jgi:hypothetical protein
LAIDGKYRVHSFVKSFKGVTSYLELLVDVEDAKPTFISADIPD